MATALIIALLVSGTLIIGTTGQQSLCSVPKSPQNGQVNCVNDRNELKCYATCNSGFAFRNTSVEFRTCNHGDGTWSTGNIFPDCFESNSRCHSLSPPTNGIVKCESVNNNLICTAKCDKQYVFPSGQSTVKRICNATIGWLTTDVIPNCVVDCNTQYLISGNRNLQDSNFVTSSTLSTNGVSFHPRKSDIFCSSDCGWRPTSSDLNQFVQIHLLNVSRLLGIVTKGLIISSKELYVTRFRILHSIDGNTFSAYSDANVTDRFFSGNADGNTSKLNVFSCPFEAKYIRINPLEWFGGIGLRFDLLGCDVASIPKTTLSPVIKSTTNPPTPRQSGTTIHPFKACTTILPPANGAVNCQKTSNELICTAICNDGFQFATTESQVLVKRTCHLQTGQWDGSKSFPACIQKQVSHTSKQPGKHNCISSQSDCNIFGNGDFQTCGDCRYFATCSEGIVYIRPCPYNLQFDSVSNTCQFKSETCFSNSFVPIG